jgi:hypothetical protein
LKSSGKNVLPLPLPLLLLFKQEFDEQKGSERQFSKVREKGEEDVK